MMIMHVTKSWQELVPKLEKELDNKLEAKRRKMRKLSSEQAAKETRTERVL